MRVGIVFGGKSGEHEISLLSAASIVSAIDRTKYEVSLHGITKDGTWSSKDESLTMLQDKLAEDIMQELRSGNKSAAELTAVAQPTDLAAELTATEQPTDLAAEMSAAQFTDPAAEIATTAQFAYPAAELTATAQLTEFAAELTTPPPLTMTEVATYKVPRSLKESVDVIFPVLHGTNGEDGVVQGLLQMLDLPYVGSGVLASALAMDKVMAKRILAGEGIPQVPFRSILRPYFKQDPNSFIKSIGDSLAYPVFVKPANLGSSVGISKVMDEASLLAACEEAFLHDAKIIVEQGVVAREIEVAVLGNYEPIAPVAGEIISSREFYDYKAKYVDGKSVIEIPAKLTEEQSLAVRELAIRIYQLLDCRGLARVDFFLNEAGEFIFNELNTMPGFTDISMYPKMLEYAGISYPELITLLLEHALEEHAIRSQ